MASAATSRSSSSSRADDMSHFATREELNKLGDELKSEMHNTRAVYREEIRQLAQELRSKDRKDWAPLLTLVGMAAALIGFAISGEGTQRKQSIDAIRDQISMIETHEAQLAIKDDRILDERTKWVEEQQNAIMAASAARHEKAMAVLASQIERIDEAIKENRNRILDQADASQNEFKRFDDVLRREMKLGNDRLDEKISAVSKIVEQVQVSRFTAADGDRLRKLVDDVVAEQRRVNGNGSGG